MTALRLWSAIRGGNNCSCEWASKVRPNTGMKAPRAPMQAPPQTLISINTTSHKEDFMGRPAQSYNKSTLFLLIISVINLGIWSCLSPLIVYSGENAAASSSEDASGIQERGVRGGVITPVPKAPQSKALRPSAPLSYNCPPGSTICGCRGSVDCKDLEGSGKCSGTLECTFTSGSPECTCTKKAALMR